MINYKQLKAFHAFMSQGSVVSAAKYLNISQPAVSKSLTNLENSLHFRLFDRKKNKLTATHEANLFYQSVLRSFIGLEEIRAQATAIANKQIGHINIAAQPIYIATYLTDVIADFRKDHPSIQITLYEEGMGSMIEKIVTQKCNIGIGLTLNMGQFDVHVDKITHCKAHCLIPYQHRLNNKTSISIDMIKNEPFVELNLGSPLRLFNDYLFYSNGWTRKISIEARTIQTVCKLVEKNMGVAIIDPFATTLIDPKKATIKPFYPDTKWDVAIFSPKNLQLNEIEKEFISRLKKAILENEHYYL